MLEIIDFEKILTSYTVKKGLDNTFDFLNREILKKRRTQIDRSASKLSIESFLRLSNEVTNWSSYMEYSPAGVQADLTKLYIDLDLHLEPISSIEEEKNTKVRLKTVLKKLNNHLILLGRPGTGKTTTVKAICHDFIRGKSPLMDFFPVPIVIRLREVDNTLSVYDLILNLLNIQINTLKSDKERDKDNTKKISEYDSKRDIVLTLLNSNKILLIFDGYDEIDNKEVKFLNKNITCKEKFVSEFREMCLNTSRSLFILTSRTADFSYYISNTVQFELSRLTENQIRKYINNYFLDKQESEKAQKEIFDKKLLGAEYIPLTLSYLCIIYKRYGRLFNSRRETYNKLLDLLLEDWDINRQIKRKSNFSSFDVYDKKRFLRQLSFALSTKYNTSFFTSSEVDDVFKNIHGDYDGLSSQDIKPVLREIETLTGLFIRSGEGYMFSHKTLQEYLFAMYMFEFPEIPSDKNLLNNFPNELALAVSFNENPSLYLAYLVLNRFDERFYREDFLFPFIDRIILEDTKFKIHVYLAVSFLTMYSNIRNGNNSKFIEEKTSYFFKFLNTDERVFKSLELLSGYYNIEEELPGDNLIKLAKNKDISPLTNYIEPKELFVSYDFYQYFVKNCN